MKKGSEIVLKAFLSGFEPSKKKALEKFLPEKEQRALAELPEFDKSIDVEQFLNGDLWEKVHWSWFLPTLKTYDESEAKLFLSALHPNAAKNLAKALMLSSYSQEITDVAKDYLRQVLMDSLKGPHDLLLPIDYLPPSPLTKLANFSKNEITRVIDLLSLYDLAAEQRLIVETKILKKIYSLLSEEEKKFLKNAMQHKEHFVLARIGLERWDGTEENLRTLLHRRGLARLGVALSGENPDLIWYICHQLDIGRGSALFKQCAKEKVPNVTDAVRAQIAELL